MKNKNVLGTGITGGIGGSIARNLVKKGYTVHAFVRDAKKARELFIFPAVYRFLKKHRMLFFWYLLYVFYIWSMHQKSKKFVIYEVNLENDQEVASLISALKDKGIVFEHAFLAAGTFKWDKDYKGSTPKEQELNAIKALTAANFATKASVYYAFRVVYDKYEKAALVITQVGSQAARFAIDDPRRVGEEGYVQSQILVDGLVESQKEFFGKVIGVNPPLVATEMAKGAFTKQTIGEDVKWEEVITPDQLAENLITGAGL